MFDYAGFFYTDSVKSASRVTIGFQNFEKCEPVANHCSMAW
jgi:hypothetical protein